MEILNEAFSKEFTTNKYGIPIVKCCASCKHHSYNGDDRKRLCLQTGKTHHSSYLCGSGWRLAENLENAGRGGGKVKKRAYLQYVLTEGKSKAADWEREHGSMYLTKR